MTLLSFFDAAHLRRFGVRAVIMPGKDASLLARLYRSHGAEMLERMIVAFFESSDPYVMKAGFSVGVFVSQTPKLVLKVARPVPVEDWHDECDRIHGGHSGDYCGNWMMHQARMSAQENP